MYHSTQTEDQMQMLTEAVRNIGGSREGARDAPPDQNFFIFMQFSGKNRQIVCRRSQGLAPPWEILDLPLRMHFANSVVNQWRIQDFPEEGAPTPKVGASTYYLVKKFPKTA